MFLFCFGVSKVLCTYLKLCTEYLNYSVLNRKGKAANLFLYSPIIDTALVFTSTLCFFSKYKIDVQETRSKTK